MHSSTLTSKGQTTIPREIRDHLKIKPHDKIVYIPDGERVFLTLVRGSILELKGALKSFVKKPIDFHQLREEVKEKVSAEYRKKG